MAARSPVLGGRSSRRSTGDSRARRHRGRRFAVAQRAEFVEGNATTCADVGDSSPSILFTAGNADNSNADVSGTVTGGTTLNVTVLNPDVQVNAVVVKGGNGYNVYRGNFPDMISPFTNGGQLPSISHWFVCYGPAEPPPPPPPPPGEGGAEAGAAVAVVGVARFTG